MKNENPLISVIVPVYNAEKTISRCIESLMKQTYHDIEIIIIDDGSKDKSLVLCKEYEKKDKRIQVISKENGGVSSARNLGMNVATGEQIMFCDSDDWVEDDWCEVLHANYREDSLTMCGFYRINDNNARIEVRVKEEVKEIDRTDYLDTKLIGGFVPWNKIFSSRVIKENGIDFSEHLTLGEDKMFIWKYINCIQGNIICIGKCLNNYIWPQNNSLTVNLPFDYYLQCDEIFNTVITDVEHGSEWTINAKLAFYNDCYLQYERAIKRVLQGKEKNRFYIANKIMKSKQYQLCSHFSEITSNSIVRTICRWKNCFGVWLLMLIKKY